MPLYEYRCNDCDEAFEKLVSFSEANRNQACPHCHSPNTQKKISRIAALGASAGSSTAAASSSCGSGGRFS